MFYRVLVFSLLVPVIALSFSVVRKDGKTFSGELIRQTENEVVLKDKQGITITFRKDQIDWDKTTQEIRKKESDSTKVIEKKQWNFVTKEISTRKKFTGEPISVDFKDVDVKDFFRFIADVSKMNLVLDPAVKGTLTIRMVEVPWDQVLDVVCKNYGLGYTIEGNVVNVDK